MSQVACYAISVSSRSERRQDFRITQTRCITEYYGDHSCYSTMVNLSRHGVYTVKTTCNNQGMDDTRHHRQHDMVQLVIDLPEIDEIIWAAGEIMFEHETSEGVGTGILFTDMTDRHRKLLDAILKHDRQYVVNGLMGNLSDGKKRADQFGQHTVVPLPVFSHPIPPVSVKAMI